MSELIRQRIRRKLSLERYRATLGDGSGVVVDHPGYVRVRYTTSDGRGMKDVVLLDGYVGPMKPGTPVWVTYNLDNELCVRAPNVRDQLATGGDPVYNNPAAVTPRSDTNPFQYNPFTSAPTTPPSMAIVVCPWIYEVNGTLMHYPGEQVDLTASQPSAGEWLLISPYLKNDNTLELLTSTAQALTEPFDLTDLQEIQDGATAGSHPNWVWRLTGDATTLTDADKYLDLRQFIDVPARYRYTPSSTADTFGNADDMAYDDSYLYVKTGAGWKRSALSTF